MHSQTQKNTQWFGFCNLPDVFTFTATEATDKYGDDDHQRDHGNANDESLEIHCEIQIQMCCMETSHKCNKI